jgi:hypothetical protein
VAAKLGPGEVVRTGDAGGPNVAGKSRQEVDDRIVNSLSEPPDPLTRANLPRLQREHAKQYNERYHELYGTEGGGQPATRRGMVKE